MFIDIFATYKTGMADVRSERFVANRDYLHDHPDHKSVVDAPWKQHTHSSRTIRSVRRGYTRKYSYDHSTGSRAGGSS